MVVQLQSHSEEEMIASALDNVSAVPSYSPICENHLCGHSNIMQQLPVMFNYRFVEQNLDQIYNHKLIQPISSSSIKWLWLGEWEKFPISYS